MSSHEHNIGESQDYYQQYSSISRSLSYEKPNAHEAFQRIKIAGNSNDMNNIEDLQESVCALLSALIIREKYFSFTEERKMNY